VSHDGLTEIFEVHREPDVTDPVLVICLEGWVDAGLGATTAIAALLGQSHTEPVVTFNGEHFLDQRARRPVARIVNGVTTELTWPRTVVRQGTDESGHDMLFLVGPEPDFHWRAFTDAVVGLARSWRVRMVVGLGAFPAPAPHTRPVKLAATAPESSANLIEQVGIVQGELEVPAGVLAALEMAFGATALPTVSLWARVPHYVAGMPFPEASAALLEGLSAVAGLTIDSSALRRAGDSSRRQVDQLIADNAEHQAMVRRLEENLDASEGNALGVDEVPTGDEIAAELERFLRGEDQ
jgi:proteasome assembly chaperone (PAC2) family protein